jgi:uncharacterized protein (DUF488 family)
MTIYTIGFTKKSAKEFFEALISHNVKKVIDIRLNNSSQLAGFTKGNDLKYFLKAIANIDYIYRPEYAPSKELLNEYKSKKVNWPEYEKRYSNILEARGVLRNINYSMFDQSCLLCSEPSPDKCHRRLLAERLAESNSEISIVHL